MDLLLESAQPNTQIVTPSVEIPSAKTPVPTTPAPTEVKNTEKPNTPAPKPKTDTKSSTSAPNVEEYTYTPAAEGEDFPIRTDAPKLNGVYYKVQLIALANFNKTNARYDGVRKLGRLDYEFITDKGVTRVLLGDYLSKAEANDVASEVARQGFGGAFIVKYENGARVGRSN
ncbi:MAG: SPOR domain-containing protein [Saprospiraceae bacterium]|nr:SPOR domain-containing protein [Saprospiraceae bacterium]